VVHIQPSIGVNLTFHNGKEQPVEPAAGMAN
jgi:hypothetical protein